jgi:hypothetical protein
MRPFSPFIDKNQSPNNRGVSNLSFHLLSHAIAQADEIIIAPDLPPFEGDFQTRNRRIWTMRNT